MVEELERNRCVLKVEPTGFADGFDNESEGKELGIIPLDLWPEKWWCWH